MKFEKDPEMTVMDSRSVFYAQALQSAFQLEPLLS